MSLSGHMLFLFSSDSDAELLPMFLGVNVIRKVYALPINSRIVG